MDFFFCNLREKKIKEIENEQVVSFSVATLYNNIVIIYQYIEHIKSCLFCRCIIFENISWLYIFENLLYLQDWPDSIWQCRHLNSTYLRTGEADH